MEALTCPKKRSLCQFWTGKLMRRGWAMVRKAFKPEQIISRLPHAKLLLSQGSTVGEANRKLGGSPVPGTSLRSDRSLFQLCFIPLHVRPVGVGYRRGTCRTGADSASDGGRSPASRAMPESARR